MQGPSSDNWAAGFQRQYAGLGLPCLFQGGNIQSLDAHGFQQAMLAREKAGMGCMFPTHGTLSPGPVFAPTSGGFPGQTSAPLNPMMSYPFPSLAQNGNSARVRLAAKYKSLHGNKAFPMIRRLFDAVVRPTVSYGCEVWGSLCVSSLPAEVRKMANIQLHFFRQTLRLRSSIAAPILFAELHKIPWVGFWWSQVVRFMQQLKTVPDTSPHGDILRDNLRDARSDPHFGNWTEGVQKKYAGLALASPFNETGVHEAAAPSFRKRVADQYKLV